MTRARLLSKMRPAPPAAKVSLSSQSQIDFTGIPSGIRRFTLGFAGASFASGATYALIQIGDSGGIENTGYDSSSGWSDTGSTAAMYSTSGFYALRNPSDSYTVNGIADFILVDPATNTWAGSWTFGTSPLSGSTTFIFTGGGSKALSAELDRVRIVLDASTFDAGYVNIVY